MNFVYIIVKTVGQFPLEMQCLRALCVGARAHGQVTVCVTCRHVVVCITCTGCMLCDRCGLKGPALTRVVVGGLSQDLTPEVFVRV